MDKRIIETTDVGTDERLTLSIDANVRLQVGDELVWSISALSAGIVALTTALRTVHIDGAAYWQLLHGNTPPNMRQAGYLTAQLAQARRQARELLDLLDQEELLDNAYYASIAEVAAKLEMAVAEPVADQLVAA